MSKGNNNNLKIKTMRDYGGVKVSCKRIAVNPCAEDEYEVTVTANGTKHIMYTFGGMFEPDDLICDRMYRQWLKEIKI